MSQTPKITKKQYYQAYKQKHQQDLNFWISFVRNPLKRQKLTKDAQLQMKNLDNFIKQAQRKAPKLFKQHCETYQQSKEHLLLKQKIKMQQNQIILIQYLKYLFNQYLRLLPKKKIEKEKSQALQEQQSKNNLSSFHNDFNCINKSSQHSAFQLWCFKSQNQYIKIKIFDRQKSLSLKPNPYLYNQQHSSSVSLLQHGIKNDSTNLTQFQEHLKQQLNKHNFLQQKKSKYQDDRNLQFILNDLLISYIISKHKLKYIARQQIQVKQDYNSKKIYFQIKMERGKLLNQQIFKKLKGILYWQCLIDCWRGLQQLTKLDIQHYDLCWRNMICVVETLNGQVVDYNTVQLQQIQDKVQRGIWKCTFKLIDFDHDKYMKDTYTPKGFNKPIILTHNAKAKQPESKKQQRKQNQYQPNISQFSKINKISQLKPNQDQQDTPSSQYQMQSKKLQKEGLVQKNNQLQNHLIKQIFELIEQDKIKQQLKSNNNQDKNNCSFQKLIQARQQLINKKSLSGQQMQNFINKIIQQLIN